MENKKLIRNGIEIDVKLAEDIKRELIFWERRNAKTKELSDSKMIEKEKKILEDKLNAY